MKHRHTFYTVMLAMLAAIFGSGTAMAQKAYTEYNSDTKTLTFYYDNDRSSRTGMTYTVVDGDYTPLWSEASGGPSNEVTTVVFDPSFADYKSTTTYYWFADMGSLETITGMAEYLNTSEVKNMSYMFKQCSSLTSVDLSGFDTKKVENMSGMFSGCESLEELSLRSFDTQNVTNTEEMFKLCSSLKTIYISTLNWDMSSVTSSDNMFQDCFELVGVRGTLFDETHTDKDYAHLDFGGIDPGYLSITPEPYAVYDGTSILTFYFDLDRASRIGYTYDVPTTISYPDWYSISNSITSVEFDPSFADARPTSTAHWFEDMQNLSLISGLEYLNTSEVTNMDAMFYDCWTLPEPDLSHFDTRKVTTMRAMFYNTNFPELDLTSFDTHNVTDMEYMFTYATSITRIYIGPEWNTDNVTKSAYMFYNCYVLEGGNGTVYDGNTYDATYARFDFGEDQPGYMTGKFEAYSVLDGGKLTFYYDLDREERKGIKFDMNTSTTTPPEWNSFSEDITKVIFDPSFVYARPVVTYRWFDQMSNLKEIEGMEYLNTSEVTDMTSMFFGCSSLTSIDVSHFDTRKVKSMHSMFRGTNITSLDLSNFETWDVVLMGSMFQDCSSLQTIYVNDGWGTVSATDATMMFYGCENLVGQKGTTYDAAFTDATYAIIDGEDDNPGYLTYKGVYAVLDVKGTLTYYNDGLSTQRDGTVYSVGGAITPRWDTMSDHGYLAIKAAVVDPSMATARPTTTRCWFGSLHVDEIKGLEYINTSEVTDMYYMFKGCTAKNLDLSHFDTRKVTNMGGMFYGCPGLTSLDLTSFNTENVTNMGSMFEFCTGLTDIDLSSFDTRNVTDISGMFRGCESLEKIDLYSFNTDNVDSWGFMFRECSELTTIYVSDKWEVMHNTFDDYMFEGCFNLVGGAGTTYDENYIAIQYAHTDKGASDPGYLTLKEPYTVFNNKTLTFYFDGKRLQREGTTYDLGSVDWYYDSTCKQVVNVTFDPSFANFLPTSTSEWFRGMTHLTTFNGLENLNTSEVTDMSYMFQDCEALTSLDLRTFNTEKVTSMYEMFTSYSFSALETLDLSSFNTANVTDVEYMFYGCSELKTIIVGDGWNVEDAWNGDMFTNCTSLVGEKGTTYDAFFIDGTYAHIDEGEDNPGYLTGAPKGNPADVNGDGKVNTADVVAVYTFVEKGEGSGFAREACDVNGDGSVNTADVVAIYTAIIGEEGAGSREFNKQMFRLLNK